jgi:hypothetical protein
MSKGQISPDVWTLIIILVLTVGIPLIALPFLMGVTINTIFLLFTVGIGLGSFILLLFSGGLIIVGVLVAPSNYRVGRILAILGVAGVLITLTIVELLMIAASTLNQMGVDLTSSKLWEEIKNKAAKYQNFLYCGSFPVMVGPGENPIKSVGDTFACIITGYLPAKASSAYYIGFWIFGIVMPLLITTGIFLDLTQSSGMLQNPISQRIVGWGLGFMALRGLYATGLIFILDVTTTGMLVILLNFIFVGGLMAYTNRIFHQWEPIEAAIQRARVSSTMGVAATQILNIVENLIRQSNLQGAANMITTNQTIFIGAAPSTAFYTDLAQLAAQMSAGQIQQADALTQLQTIRRRYNF